MDFSVRSFLDFLHVILISSFQMMIVKYHDCCCNIVESLFFLVIGFLKEGFWSRYHLHFD